MTDQVALVDDLNARAAVLAKANPPSRVIATTALGVFMAIGFVIGRAWLGLAHVISFLALAIRQGYWAGIKAELQPKQPSQQ
jgi:hypothetical protein